jgi:hypothetical protein
MKLNELPPETLQWMFNKATIEIMDIDDYIARAKRHGLNVIVGRLIDEKKDLKEKLAVLSDQLLRAMGDIEVNKQIMSN